MDTGHKVLVGGASHLISFIHIVFKNIAHVVFLSHFVFVFVLVLVLVFVFVFVFVVSLSKIKGARSHIVWICVRWGLKNITNGQDVFRSRIYKQTLSLTNSEKVASRSVKEHHGYKSSNRSNNEHKEYSKARITRKFFP